MMTLNWPRQSTLTASTLVKKDQRVEQVLAAVGNTMFVGYSCNQPAQIKHANQLPVAYVGSGPIFANQLQK